MKFDDKRLWKHPTLIKVWQAAKKIPRGRVTTYGVLATAAGYPRAARLSGFAMKHCPPKMKVPWHRVLNAQGRSSLPARSAAWRRQRDLLEAEGVAFIGGRVDLARYGWGARNDSPLLD